jgi:hypothetical protein
MRVKEGRETEVKEKREKLPDQTTRTEGGQWSLSYKRKSNRNQGVCSRKKKSKNSFSEVVPWILLRRKIVGSKQRRRESRTGNLSSRSSRMDLQCPRLSGVD